MRSLRGKYVISGIIAAMALALLAPGLLHPRLERLLVVEKDLQRADAIVVMAGSAEERIPVAARLYKEGRAARILLTNDGIRGAWSPEHQRNLYHVEWAELELLQQHIPPRAIEKLPFSESGSIYDALNALAFARGNEMHALLVVTSDYHTCRTLWSFWRAAGDDPVVLGVYPVPSVETSRVNLVSLYALAYEGLKNVYYRWMYDPEWIAGRVETKTPTLGRSSRQESAFVKKDEIEI